MTGRTLISRVLRLQQALRVAGVVEWASVEDLENDAHNHG